MVEMSTLPDRAARRRDVRLESAVLDLSGYSLAEILSGEDTALRQAAAGVVLGDRGDAGIAAFGNRI